MVPSTRACALMPVALLDSQFATLEEPTPDEHPVIEDVEGKPADIAHDIGCQLEDRDRHHEPEISNSLEQRPCRDRPPPRPAPARSP